MASPQFTINKSLKVDIIIMILFYAQIPTIIALFLNLVYQCGALDKFQFMILLSQKLNDVFIQCMKLEPHQTP